MSNATPSSNEPTLESLLAGMHESRQRLDNSYSKLFDKYVSMGFTSRPPAVPETANVDPVDVPRVKTMLEQVSALAQDLHTLANSYDWASECLARQYSPNM